MLQATAAGLVGLAAGPTRAGDPPALPAAGAPFGATTVTDLARALARQPYAAPPEDDLPEALATLGREQYAAIRTVPGSAIWASDNLGFAIEPLHRGSIYRSRVALALVEDGQVRPVAYDPGRFAGTPLPAFAEDPGYSGFRLSARFDGGELAEFAIFQGASFFRLVAAGQAFGVTARALTLRPGDARGEEFPQFRAVWFERPAPGGPLVLHLLVESESATAALRMRLVPGQDSIAEVAGTLFARTALDHVGLGGMTTRYLFGPHDRRGADDARAAVHASDGLRIRTGRDEAIWRPVRNPETLQVSAFLDDNPKGFGLMQRARDYAAFQDDLRHWERRPSLWLEPEGQWGPGAVTLVEIPSDSELNENVLAYWRPSTPIAAGAEAPFGYRLTWCWRSPERPPVATVTGTRAGRGTEERRRFLVDFTGDILFAEAELQTVLIATPGTIASRTLHRYPERKTVRVAFELDAGGERTSELRLLLRRAGRPVTETWLYRWTP
ncbi:MAG TPA: glucan biosynthesis protein D [Methylobacterium sp.]